MTLDNGILRAEILTQWHDSTRFDRMFTVSSLKLIARDIEFMAPESLIPNTGSGGSGLANEFGIMEPIGYTDAAPGEMFLKPDVGWLVRDEKPYRFSFPYEIADRGQAEYVWGENSVEGTWDSGVRRGYGCKVWRRLSLEGNELVMDYRMENTGEKPFDTTEYNHNFVLIGGHLLSEDYELVTGCAAADAQFMPWVTLGKYPSHKPALPPVSDGINGWRLTHKPDGCSCRRSTISRPRGLRYGRKSMWHLPRCLRRLR